MLAFFLPKKHLIIFLRRIKFIKFPITYQNQTCHIRLQVVPLGKRGDSNRPASLIEAASFVFIKSTRKARI